MYKGKKILGLISARGGSKGLPGKNIKPLCGKPLIAWTIEQARNSRYLDLVMVNTDSQEIAAVSKRYGARIPFLRPKKLATHKSKIIDTLLHTLEYFDKKGAAFDYLVLLEPTSPLRKDSDIDNAIKKLIDAGRRADSLISVGKIALEHPVYAKKILENDCLMPYYDLKKSLSLRQELPTAYFPYGVIYMSKAAAIKKYRSAYGGKTIPYAIERWQNYEINDIWDFLCVEAVLKAQKERCK